VAALQSSADARAARPPAPARAVAAVFFAFGADLGLWSGASAHVLKIAGVSPPLFGVALTLFIAVYLLAMSGGGVLARVLTVRRSLLIAVPLCGVSVAGLILSPAPWAVFAGLAGFGAFGGLTDLMMNAEATRAEAELGVRLLAGMHARASLAVGVGALAGSYGAVTYGTAPVAAAALVVPLGVAVYAWLWLPRRGIDRVMGGGHAPRSLFTRDLITLGLVLGVSMAGEFTATMWSATLLQAQAPKLADIAGLGASFFALCQAALRFSIDALRRRIADARLMVGSLVVALIGFVGVALQPSFALTVASLALIGLGTGAIVPCGFALAVSRARLAPSAALSVAALFTGVARLPTPLAMGALAAIAPLSAAFALSALLFAAAVGGMLTLKNSDAATPQTPRG
jgi:hypothetical protein